MVFQAMMNQKRHFDLSFQGQVGAPHQGLENCSLGVTHFQYSAVLCITGMI